MNTEQARFNMIEQQIRPWDVLDQGVLALLAMVRREDFVPPAYRGLAFMDTEVPLVAEGADGQVMLAPRVEARLLQEAHVQRHERVLEIGTGSGFMAALLAHKAQAVTTLERVPALAQQAVANLRHANIANVTVKVADGAGGDPTGAPYDVIMLAGSVAAVPRQLVDQLKPGGRLIAIVGQEPVMRALRVTKLPDQSLQTEVLFDTVAPRLAGFDEPTRFHF